MSRTTRTAWVHVKATPAERDAWQALASADGLTLADFIRGRLAADQVGHAPRRRRMPAPAADPALLAGIARAGNNLNQLARWANTYLASAGQVQLLAALAAIERQLSSFLPPNAPAQAGAADAEGEAG